MPQHPASGSKTPPPVRVRRQLPRRSLAVAGGLGIAAALGIMPAAGADPAPASVAFACNGAEQTFTVPAGISSVMVHAIGAAGGGGGGYNSLGGQGAEVSGTLAVTGGTVLYVEVGCTGQTGPGAFGAGGFGGGGVGGGSASDGIGVGAGGGGASDVRSTPAALSGSLASRLIVAAGGGGGGGGASSAGGNAGSGGGADVGSGGAGGGGAGSSTAGGADGTAGGHGTAGQAGVLGIGGGGGTNNEPHGRGGGGGGGGLYGGGGGGGGAYTSGGGGGGASLVPTGGTGPTVTSAAPSVTITYAPTDTTAPTVTITTPADGASYAQGQAVPADYTCQDEPGGSGIDSCTGPVADGTAIDTSTAGSHAFTVSTTDNAGNTGEKTVHYTVTAATQTSLSQDSRTTIDGLVGNPVTFTAHVTSNGEPVGAGSVEFIATKTGLLAPVASSTLCPSAPVTAGTATCTVTLSGIYATYTVTAHYSDADGPYTASISNQVSHTVLLSL